MDRNFGLEVFHLYITLPAVVTACGAKEDSIDYDMQNGTGKYIT